MPSSIDDLNKGLGFGLNARGSASSVAAVLSKKKESKRSTKKAASVFDESSDDDSSEDDRRPSARGGRGTATGRSAVNAEIAQEQAALRQRAEAAMGSAASSSEVYNYDDGYEEFSMAEREAKRKAATAAASQSQQPERKSRYIGQLLKTAESRKREHEILRERRVAREQAAEEANNAVEFAGKDKYVTKSYKRKLAEREAWLKEEESKEKEEKAAGKDRRKDKGGIGMASFLGSVVRGDNNDKEDVDISGGRKEDTNSAGGFTDGFSRDDKGEDHDGRKNYADTRSEHPPKLAAAARVQYSGGNATVAQKTKKEEEAVLRRKRNAMIAAARERYLERKRTGEVAAMFSAVR